MKRYLTLGNVCKGSFTAVFVCVFLLWTIEASENLWGVLHVDAWLFPFLGLVVFGIIGLITFIIMMVRAAIWLVVTMAKDAEDRRSIAVANRARWPLPPLKSR